MQIKKEKQIKTKKRTQTSSKKHSKQQPLHRVEKEKFPHFRYYKKSGHPTLIVGEQVDSNHNEEWIYKKTGHNLSKERGGYEIISPNPNKNDNRPMHIGKRKRHDKKKYFEPKALSWKLPKNKK